MDCLLSRQFHAFKCYSHALTLTKSPNSKRKYYLPQTDYQEKYRSKSCRYLSSTVGDFNELISPTNKDRVIKNLLTVKPGRSLPLHKDYREAATLIPICTVNRELSILYTLRSRELKYGRGEISFPGGMKDDSDKSLTETALRETHEEIGLSINSIEVWGSMLPLTDSQATKLITPVIGFCGEVDTSVLKFNKNEVSLVFTRSIAQLCHPDLQATTQYRTGYTLPIYLGKPQRIWGLTALTTYQFLSLFAPEHHKFRLKHQRPLSVAKVK